MRITKTNPILAIFNDFLIDSPLPTNINYFWSFGSLLGLNMVIVIISGITLAMHYSNHTSLAFNSIEHIMRDVNMGWLIRYVHANGASFFFIFVYLHIARGLYYGSYRSPRALLWNIGVIIFLIMMASFWPSWYIDKLDTVMLSSLPFIQPKTLAIKRIGPHNKDILDQLIIGLLGNWWGNRIPSKKRFSYRFQIDQEKHNKQYLSWLTNFFYIRGYCQSPYPKRIFRGNRLYSRLTLFTFTNLDWVFNGFYYYDSQNKIFKKRVPLWIKHYFTPISLATWIMQNGSIIKEQGVLITTNCFTKEECLFLANLLTELFDLKTSVVSAGFPNQWSICICKSSLSKLKLLIGPYMIGNMYRKFFY